MVAQGLRQAARQKEQGTLSIHKCERVEFARGAPHNTHNVLRHELVRADSCADNDKTVSLELNLVSARSDEEKACSSLVRQDTALGESVQRRVSNAWREEDARLAGVKRNTGMPLQLLSSHREHVAQVDRVAGVALEVICRRVEHDAGAARLDRQVGGMDGKTICKGAKLVTHPRPLLAVEYVTVQRTVFPAA